MSALRAWGERSRDWLTGHLAALVWIMLALWSPPIVFTVLVDLKVIDGAGSGYLELRDPGLLLSILLISVMASALPLLHLRRRSGAWHLLCAAIAIWTTHAAWTILGRLRLIGRSDLLSRETLTTVTALAVAAGVLLAVRGRYTRYAATTALPTTSQPPAALRPDTM